jgi:hypothetical protein
MGQNSLLKAKLLFLFPIDLQCLFTFPKFHSLRSLVSLIQDVRLGRTKLGRAKLGLPLGKYAVETWADVTASG